MLRWEKYVFAFRDYIILLILLSFSYILLLNNDKPQIYWVRSHVLNVVGIWQNEVSSIFRYRTLKIENEILRKRLALLSYENSLMKEAYLENDRLRNLLGFKKSSKKKLIPVSIIRQNYEGFSHTFHVNVGSKDGVEVSSPVVSSTGLIGKTVLSSSNSSVIQVLDDINFRVGAMIQRSRVSGIVRPDKNSGLHLDFIPMIADVKVGDVVITSGYSDIYPKGIEIGIVSKVEKTQAGLFQDVRIVPAVDLENIEEAFIILN